MAEKKSGPFTDDDEVDVLITGNAVVVGAATVGAGVYAAIRDSETGDLSETYSPAVKAAKAGFKAAMAGQPAPARHCVRRSSPTHS